MTAEIVQIERAYVFNPRGAADGGSTPPGEMEAAVLRIVEHWNERIPKRVRRLTQLRFNTCRDALAIWTADEIVGAIDHYAGQKWQRQKNAWKRFENFIERDTVTPWVEDAFDAAERRQATADRQAARAAELQKQADEHLAHMRHVDEVRRRMTSLPAAEQAELLHQAARELPEPMRGMQAALMRQAVLILDRADKKIATEARRTQRTTG